MTQLTEFAVGADKSHLATFASLGIPAPIPHFQVSADTALVSNGLLVNLGFPQCPLDFPQLTIAQRNTLRGKLANQSNAVTMALPTKEYSGGNGINNETWKTYDCIVDWPFPEPTEAGDHHTLLNFRLNVRQMVAVTPA
jgi:hypothetical protein